MKALIELNYWNGPTEFIAYDNTTNENGHIFVTLYYAVITTETLDIDGEYEYYFWSLPPEAAAGDENGYALPAFTMKESEIDWSDYESTAPWRNGVNKGGHRE